MAEPSGSEGETRYKIGDVCRLADVQPYVLRYWESEFPVLAPDKSASGPRTYSARELKLIEQIKRLLYDEGYTIAGAKKRLEGDGGAGPKDKDADTNPVVTPIPAEPAKLARAEKPAKAVDPAEKPEKPERSEKAEKARPPRSAKADAPAFADAAKYELPAPEVTKPVDTAAAREKATDDDRVGRAVAELKEVLALLSRSEP